ncbi:MAG: hypothetical protein IKC75_03605 [Clostridia bacterium]|nr:hypothetical protein [Clostridia bacterium]
MKSMDFEYVERRIGYTFQHKRLLEQAFTRKSYINEKKDAQSNEVLEFYGDRALELVITQKMSRYFGKVAEDGLYHSTKDEGDLTKLKVELVRKEMLSFRIRAMELEARLFMSRGDKKQAAFERDSVQEDLFEAILGAVAMDSDWDVKVLTRVVERMLNPEFYFKYGLDDRTDHRSLLGEWYQKRYGVEPNYQIERVDRHFYCKLKVQGFPLFKAESQGPDEAQRECAKQAVLYLKERGEMSL